MAKTPADIVGVAPPTTLPWLGNTYIHSSDADVRTCIAIMASCKELFRDLLAKPKSFTNDGSLPDAKPIDLEGAKEAGPATLADYQSQSGSSQSRV